MKVDDFEELEELQLDSEEFELIEKFQRETFPVPIVCVHKKSACFNSKSSPLIPDRIKWYTTNDYVIGVPAKKDDVNGYIAKKIRGSIIVHTPSGLIKEKRIKEGYYKVYKYKDGFAFKRYEQFDKDSK